MSGEGSKSEKVESLKRGPKSREFVESINRYIVKEIESGNCDRNELIKHITKEYRTSSKYAKNRINDVIKTLNNDGTTHKRVIQDKDAIEFLSLDRSELAGNNESDVTDNSKISRFSNIASRWKGTHIGERLADYEQMETKFNLAKQVVDILVENTNITTIFLSSGTTCLTIADEIVQRKSELSIRAIYSINLTILDYFIEYSPKNIRLRLLEGELDNITGSLVGDFGKYNKDVIKSTIVCFTGLASVGLHVSEHWEARHLHKLIQLGSSCEMAIIPMTGEKISEEVCVAHECVEKGGFPLSFKSSMKCKRYVLITDLDEKAVNSNQNLILNNWKNQGGEVKYL